MWGTLVIVSITRSNCFGGLSPVARISHLFDCAIKFTSIFNT